MARIDDSKVEEIVARVVEKLAPALERASRDGGGRVLPTPAKGEVCAPNPPHVAWQARNASGGGGGGGHAVHRGGRRGIYDDGDSAVKAARAAHEHLVHKMSLTDRDRIIASFRAAMHEITPEISQMAVDETGLGRVD